MLPDRFWPDLNGLLGRTNLVNESYALETDAATFLYHVVKDVYGPLIFIAVVSKVGQQKDLDGMLVQGILASGITVEDRLNPCGIATLLPDGNEPPLRIQFLLDEPSETTTDSP